MDKAQVVRLLRQMREHVRNHLAALTARAELPMRLRQVAILSLKSHKAGAAWHRLIVQPNELRLVVPSVDVTECARTKNHQYLFRLRGKVRRPSRLRAIGRPFRMDRLGAKQSGVAAEQRQQRD